MAGPVGFEPTILGSEGPRLGPGSTTGPATVHHSLGLLLPWAIRLDRERPGNPRDARLTIRGFRPRIRKRFLRDPEDLIQTLKYFSRVKGEINQH
jgi:hypothetical protein